MLWLLVYGDQPAVQDEPVTWERGFGSGKFDAFILLGHVLDLRFPNPSAPARQALVELRDLYTRHRAEVDTAATAAGLERPWVAEFLEEHAQRAKGEGR